MRMHLKKAPLEGAHIRLEPVSESHRDAMRAMVEGDPDAWSILLTNGQGEAFGDYFATMCGPSADPHRIAFALKRLSDGAIVGTTSFYDIAPRHGTVEIGGTYYRPDARGGIVNPEAKYLLLAHAFGNGALRVQLRTDARNARSQAAIEKLGAKKEGVIRRQFITWNGHHRDSVIYSIIAEEWPEVKAGLERRLSTFTG
ncbi:GNAT family N-acetyltransferase [Allosphingosinicella flava]|uniref:GNAT family N-acetyltransferase n=1 Tax=Allosphingosinicella flava TaxID=2771430 RepID=A0A7T2LLC2_9SPHN|nr:GNAT family protein [Sphingosinicella flava]QPQ54218.1 GNAT family N-acetyltransferase [Sphingosinicella flava]